MRLNLSPGKIFGLTPFQLQRPEIAKRSTHHLDTKQVASVVLTVLQCARLALTPQLPLPELGEGEYINLHMNRRYLHRG